MMILGDIHGEYSGLELFLEDEEEKYCIQVGDFGFLWEDSDLTDAGNGAAIVERDFPHKQIFVVPGNHENYDLIYSLPIVEVFGAKARKFKENIFFIERGEILTIEGKTYLCVGGADSTDKDWRITREHYDGKKIWWEQEAITQGDIMRAVNNYYDYVESSGNKQIDYIITHECPFWVAEQFYPYPARSASEDFLNVLHQFVDYKEWFCGHLHTTQDFIGCYGAPLHVLGINILVKLKGEGVNEYII